MSVFTGLSAFPLTPLKDDAIDERAFVGLVERLATARVESITVLGSTGSYAYLTVEERARVARVAVEHADNTTVFVGVGALRASHVLANVRSAEDTGGGDPARADDLPALDSGRCVRAVPHRDRTHGAAGDRLRQPRYHALHLHPGAVRPDRRAARNRVDQDPRRTRRSRCCTSPHPGDGRPEEAAAESERLAPLWGLFAEFGGSLRVVAAIAEHLGLAPEKCLPLPIQRLTAMQRARVAGVVDELGLG